MKLPFTVEEFLTVFQSYNLAIWPLQIVAYLSGAIVLFLVVRQPKHGDRMISAILALMWLWNGVFYHAGFFSAINKAAAIFGALFAVQGLLFIWRGVLRDDLVFGSSKDGYSLTGGLFVFYAMVMYPVLGALAGHSWPHSPVFGVAPCPSTIFTFGLLLLTRDRVPKQLLVIPLLWAMIGLSAAVNLRVYEDFGLLAAGLAGTTLLLMRDRKAQLLMKEV